MKRFLLLLPISILAADIIDIGEITDHEGIEIHKCHTNDVSLIEVATKNSDKERQSGRFSTTNSTIYADDVVMTMIPTGTNIFRIRTLCAGSTSGVFAVQFVIRRPIQTPFATKAERFPAMPPSPPGMPLPGGRILTNESAALNAVPTRVKNQR